MKRIAWGTVALAILVAAGLASAQAPPPPKPAEQEKPKPPAKKAKKVWTGEDLQDLKRPWEEYVEKKETLEAEKAAKEEAAKEAPKAEGEEPPAPEEMDPVTGKKILDPESVEALERDLKGWEDELKRTQQLAEDARQEMNSSPDQDAWESAKGKLEIYEQNVVDIQQKIEELRVQIAEKKKTQGKPPAKAPGQPAATTPPQS